MKTYKTPNTFCQSILFLLFLWMATLQMASAQLTHQKTLLMQKAFEGDTISLKYLIKAGADINKPHRSGNLSEYLYTALDYAILGKQKKTIDFLRRHGALWEEEKQRIYSTVIKLGDRMDADMLDYILTKGVRFGELEKFHLLIKFVTMPPPARMPREIVRICLRDTLEITLQKVERYLP